MVKKLLPLLMIFSPLVYAESLPSSQFAPPDNSPPALTLHGKGVQIYQCVMEGQQATWRFFAPNAQLYDNQDHPVGKHFAGPVWEYQDKSGVAGKITKSLPAQDKTAIDWLMLAAILHKGNGVMSAVNYISRINTKGGLPPTEGCDTNHLGAEQSVAYSADYVFYVKP